jgi:hypothetical protein
MSAFPYTIAAIVVAGVTASAALAVASERTAKVALSCDLLLAQTGQYVTLQAEASAPVATRGTYRLDIAQHSLSGHSTVQQNGEFDLVAGQRTNLAEARFAGRAQDISATLTLWADGDSRTCSTLSL